MRLRSSTREESPTIINNMWRPRDGRMPTLLAAKT